MASVGCVWSSWCSICFLAVLWVNGCYSQNFYDLRLVNGDQSNKGRVEIYISYQWMTICDNYHWGLDEARVVCRQLGYGDDNVIVRRDAYFGQGSGLTRQLRCSGTETRVAHCAVENALCLHADDAGVECGDSVTPYPFAWPTTFYYGSNNIRLMGGGIPSEGRVEIFYSGQWNTLCDDNWGANEAEVVCRQLGYDSDGAVARTDAYFGQGSGPIRQARCNGWETRLDDCSLIAPFSCYHYEDAGVECEGQPLTTFDYYGSGNVRLLDGDSAREGRVEIYWNYQWNTICDDNWAVEEAQVVCRQLGYDSDGAVARSSAYFGQGSGPIRHIECSGYESVLNTCINTYSTCLHYEDAGVTCIQKTSTSTRVIGVMSFVGVALFLLTVVALVAVVYTCNKSKQTSPTTEREMQPLSTLTTPPASGPGAATTAPLQVNLAV